MPRALILLPARTSLRQLEGVLEDAGVPYRPETSSQVYGAREVRDLLMVARAVEDPPTRWPSSLPCGPPPSSAATTISTPRPPTAA